MKTLAAGLVLLLVTLVQVKGHGMLIDPVNRASMWRFGYNTPPNYDDDGLFCGGQSVQWDENDGHCGECGDDWSEKRPRSHENGGKFGTGVIVKNYQEGEVINVTVRLTANHQGWYTYNLCPLKTSNEMETDECFEQHPVLFSDGKKEYEFWDEETGDFPMQLQLPKGLKCEHCVLQWTWETASTWDYCDDGTSGMGCGPQEHFRTCSDIAIL